MIELLKAYTNELDLVYDQIEILQVEADKDEELFLQKILQTRLITYTIERQHFGL